jgi:hypothetical protein
VPQSGGVVLYKVSEQSANKGGKSAAPTVRKTYKSNNNAKGVQGGNLPLI